MKQVRIKISWDQDIIVPADIFADFFELFRCCNRVLVSFNQPDSLITDPLIMSYEDGYDPVCNPAGNNCGNTATQTDNTAEEAGEEAE